MEKSRFVSFATIVAMSFALLLSPSPAQAQSDSFFDIFTDIELPDPECDPCKALEAEIAAMQQRIQEIYDELAAIDDALSNVDDAMESAKQRKVDLQKQLDEMRDPKNYVEGDGRRYDSSDHAAMRRRSANLWQAYKNGDMSAEEYSEEVGKPFDDPDVAEELEKLKEEIEQELEDGIADAEQSLEDLQEQKDALNARADELTQELQDALDELERLLAALEDCRKRCKKEEVHIPEDYGIGQEERGWLEGISDWIESLFTPDPPIIPGIDDIFDDDDEGGGPGGGRTEPFDTEMLPMDLRGSDPLPGGGYRIDSFFDVFVELSLPPPVCHLCDPIRQEVENMQNALRDLEHQKAEADAALQQAYADRQRAEDAKRAAERALEELNNPRNYAESEGRRYDGSDHAAMQARNSRLWGDYKSGNISASELEAEWGKPFDDSEVQRELQEIKDRMRGELEDTIEEANRRIEDLQESITDLINEAVELAGSIGAHEVLLQHLLRDLEECERRCREPLLLRDQLDETMINLDRILQEINRSAETPDESAQEDYDEEIGEESETVQGPKECDAPAVPMSRCRSTCHTTCTPSGVRIWLENNTVKIEECGICPPLEIDLCPEGLYFEKEQCESEGDCKCAEKAKSSGGSPCYACKEREQKFGCNFPIIGGWLCGDRGDQEQKVLVSREGDISGEKTGFLCNWFGIGCPRNEGTLTLGQVGNCFGGNGDPGLCSPLDGNHDGVVNGQDVDFYNFSLNGPSGLAFPLTINSMDGDDRFTPADFDAFGRCLLSGGPACDGLGVGDPPSGVFGTIPTDALLGIGPNDMRINMTNGNDVLLGDPVTPNFFGFDGATGFDGGPNPPPLPPDFFAPGSGLFGGNVQLFGPGGDAMPNPPPVPRSTEQEVVQRLINEVMARLRNEPLGPCEKFVVTIIRQRIGNVTRYIARVTKVRDEVKCPPEASQCPPGQYGDYDVCNRECMNTQGCMRVGLGVIGIGNICYVCPPGSGEEDQSGCQSDSDCDDGDECTRDTCERETRMCKYDVIKGCGRDEDEVACPDFAFETAESCRRSCTQGVCDRYDDDCWVCADRRLQCPLGEYGSVDLCNFWCVKPGTCLQNPETGCFKCREATQTRSSVSSTTVTTERCDAPFEDQATCERECFAPCKEAYTRRDGVKCYECPPAERCDPPTETEAECRRECFGTCQKSYTRNDGVKCFECVPTREDSSVSSATNVQPERCDAGTSELSACRSSCDGTCEKSYRRGDGVDCYSCRVQTTTPQCPSGTAANLEDCQRVCSSQGGTCQQKDGCYQCVVVNCPSGYSKDQQDCPSGVDTVRDDATGVTCYKCKQDCTSLCAEHGYGPESTDHSNAILNDLNREVCVSGASISIQTATIGDCRCIGDYSITINRTVPVCDPTPCGPVQCNSSASCETAPNTTTTVTCNWGGWEKVQKHQFRPVFGN